MIPPALFFFLQIVLVIQGVLCFHTNFKIFCSSSVKNAIGILIGIALNLYIALRLTDFKSTVSNMLKEWKEITEKELKETKGMRSHQLENTNKEI